MTKYFHALSAFKQGKLNLICFILIKVQALKDHDAAETELKQRACQIMKWDKNQPDKQRKAGVKGADKMNIVFCTIFVQCKSAGYQCCTILDILPDLKDGDSYC